MGDKSCDIDDRPAVARIRWTVYGGAFEYAYVCERHWAYVRGRRGVDVYVGNSQDNVRGWTGSSYVPAEGPSGSLCQNQA